MTDLTNTQRLTMKKALLKAGKKVAGLSDDDIQQEYGALMGEPMQAQAEEIEAATPPPVVQAESAVTAVQMPADYLGQIIFWLDIARATNCDWPFLVGPAGSGKTTLSGMVAKHLNIPFEAVESLTDKFELTGFVDANGNYQETAFYRAFKHGGVFLMDEIDRSAPDAVIAFNMALANGFFTFPNGERVERHPDCNFIAGGNTDGTGPTIEYSTAQLLDGSTRDRFHKINVEYCPIIEKQIAHDAAAKFDTGYSESAVNQWLSTLQMARVFAATNGLEVIVSPRKAISGGAMIGKGCAVQEVKRVILSTLFTDSQLKQMGV